MANAGYKRILTIQDISCFGQCSLTVALPILSACGFETCIIPSAVLSTHTGGFTGFTCRDLSEDIPQIAAHWKNEGISFDAIYTGYLGGISEIASAIDIIDELAKPGALIAIDPAMADLGKLYPAFDEAYVEAMKGLCAKADIVLPNITEACFLTGTPYRESYDRAWIDELLEKVLALGAKSVVLTGVSYDDETTGVCVYDGDISSYYRHRRISKGCHGTGDVYASAFVGLYLNGFSIVEAASGAADFVVMCIESTIDDKDHWYGVKFEPVLGKLIEEIAGAQ
ncbi:MAG: pyridoxamine kinase [bacterium]|nr:pyridoxamine kinase [bacterium]